MRGATTFPAPSPAVPAVPTLVIVESPNKARKLAGYLGSDYVVKASFGHVADLPEREYGVDRSTLEESYVVRDARVVGELKKMIAGGRFDRVLLASDPDREGEAIAWHLARTLKVGGRGQRDAVRIEFREITPAAIRAAVARPRPIDLARVDAQRARRVLDRIVGFDCSQEICWPAGARSAGRCQTPALHLLCLREHEIRAFVARTYWTLEAAYGEGFTAFVPAEPDAGDASAAEAGGARAEGAGDEEGARRGRLVPRQFESREAADAVLAEARAHPHVVRGVDARRTTRRPPPPYTTATLQQDASRKLRLSAKQAMDAAQALFEAGLITYHRTDSVRVGDDAAAEARAWIAAHHPEALPETAPRARVGGGAQDAHEAVRPTRPDADVVPPPGAPARLYAMIRARFLASQSRPATFDRTTVWIDSGPVAWVAEGAVLREPGFLVFWGPYARAEDVVLPAVTPGQRLAVDELTVHEKATTPPPRYDQGALIQALERLGIGRPATFASIIETLLRREYVQELTGARGKTVLQPTAFGLQVDALVAHAFPALVTPDYTADMEGRLDAIERGAETRPAYLQRWYADFRAAMAHAQALGAAWRTAHGVSARAPAARSATAEDTTIPCDRCGQANYRKVQRRAKRAPARGRGSGASGDAARNARGSFLACPACRMTRDVRAAVRPAGCPTCGSALVVKRIGKMPPFWGCVRYGADERPCTYRAPYAEGDAPARRTRAPSASTAGVAAPGAATDPPGDAGTPAAPRRRTRTASADAPRAAAKRTRAAASRSTSIDAPGAAPSEAPSEAPRRRTRRAAAPTYTTQPTDKRCPRCASATLEIRTPTAAGTPSYACPGAACGFTLPLGARRRRTPCPTCGGVVLERREGGTPAWRCARECGYAEPLATA